MTYITFMNWAITPHVCRVCMGRVLAQESMDGTKTFRCADCGVERTGEDETVICTCGLKLKTKIDAGFRCITNEMKTPDCMGEIIALQVNPI